MSPMASGMGGMSSGSLGGSLYGNPQQGRLGSGASAAALGGVGAMQQQRQQQQMQSPSLLGGGCSCWLCYFIAVCFLLLPPLRAYTTQPSSMVTQVG